MAEFNLTFEDAMVEAIRGKIVRNHYFSSLIYRFHNGSFQYKGKCETDWKSCSFSYEERNAEWAIFQEPKTAAEKIQELISLLEGPYVIELYPATKKLLLRALKELKKDLE